MTRDWSVSDSAGAASCRSRTFLYQSVGRILDSGDAKRRWFETLILPTMSFLTGVNAIEPKTSAHL